MSWNSTTPPINPPERAMNECRDCDGSGETVDYAGPFGPLVARVQWCDSCGGHGVIDPATGGYDTVKEARGLA